jgi:DNA-binding MurR/RpiR family transcriptional regulator
MSKLISATILKKKIDSGASSYDCARTFGVSQSTVIRRAKQYGLQFKGKSAWRNL